MTTRNPAHESEPAIDQSLRRRQMLRRGFWAGAAVLAAGGLAAAADFLGSVTPHGFGGVVTVPPDKVPRPGGEPYYYGEPYNYHGEPYHYREGKLWLVNLQPGEGGLPQQIAQYDPRGGLGEPSHSGGLLALSERCTHLNCVLPWRPDFAYAGVTGWFRCPCHSMTYTKAGLRVYGPVQRPMDTFRIIDVSAGGVSVDTGYRRLGGIDDPQRVVPPGPYI